MKIMFLITGLGVGGAERQVCDLADKLSAYGHQVVLVFMTGKACLRPRSSSVKLINMGMQKNFINFMKKFYGLYELIKDIRPDIVHSHMVHANIFARLVRLVAPIPRLICTAHSTNEGNQLRMRAYRITDHLCDLTTNVSKKAVKTFIEQGAVPSERIVPVYNGIDTSRFFFDSAGRFQLREELGITESMPLLVAVGRLTAAKDYPNLLVGFYRLVQFHESVKLVIVGEGEEEQNLKALVKNLGVSDKVHFVGMRSNVREWMSAADVFVLSSAWEGFPLVVAEAMACERVVVATDCGGVRELVGQAALVVPPNDSDQLAKALYCALNMSFFEREQLGRAARRRVVTFFSLESVAQHWLTIYQG